MKIKFIDLTAQNCEIRERVEREFAEIHKAAAYVGGPQVAAFESEFAAFLGVRRVIGVSSGTDALRLSLIALGVGPADEVITAPMTFIATAEAIAQTGARPVFVDIDPGTGNMSGPALERYLREGRFKSPNGPRAVVPVHLYGLPAPLIELRAIADRHGLKLVEDACQALGARLSDGSRWVRAGTVGAAGCFSFYPGKNLGAWGEGGAVATNDDELAAKVAQLRAPASTRSRPPCCAPSWNGWKTGMPAGAGSRRTTARCCSTWESNCSRNRRVWNPVITCS